jgi:hypothetical protein
MNDWHGIRSVDLPSDRAILSGAIINFHDDRRHLPARSPKFGATMIAWPWYLFSGGIVLIIIGAFMTSLSRLGSGRPHIHPKMSNKKIARLMKKEQRVPLGNVVILVGLLIVFVSIVWRLVRQFV